MLKPKKKKQSKRENSGDSSIRSKTKMVTPVDLVEDTFVRAHEDKNIESQLETSIEKKR